MGSTFTIRVVLDQAIEGDQSDAEKGGSVRITNRRLSEGSIHITFVKPTHDEDVQRCRSREGEWREGQKGTR